MAKAKGPRMLGFEVWSPGLVGLFEPAKGSSARRYADDRR